MSISMIRSTAGFTLVELMVTIVVVGVTTASISSIYISIRSIQTQATYYDTATRAAQREIETLRNDNYDSLTPGQTFDFTSNLPTTLPGSRGGSAVVSQPSADLRRVDATVSYTLGGTTHSVELSSLIGEIGIAQ